MLTTDSRRTLIVPFRNKTLTSFSPSGDSVLESSQAVQPTVKRPGLLELLGSGLRGLISAQTKFGNDAIFLGISLTAGSPHFVD
jgi:hypothetical protein